MKYKNILLGSLVLFQACNNSTVEPDNKPNLRTLTTAEDQVSKSNETFAFNIFREANNLSEDNVFISPISISTALGMTLNGADGDTKAGILQAINYGGLNAGDVNEGYKGLSSLINSADNKVTFNLANSVWYKNTLTINTNFANTVKTYYNGNAEALDFNSPDNAKKIINDWVENNTNHKIKDIIEEVPESAVMYLVNATYFKGTWQYEFDKSLTKKDNFYTTKGTVEVDMMTRKDTKYVAFANDTLTLVDLPYGNGQFSMTVFMPNGKHSVEEVNAKLSSSYLKHLLASSSEHTMALTLPKFTMKWKQKLNTPLSNLGMQVAFSNEARFPFLFTQNMPLTISEVIHQSFIEVSEEGTEAAAATSIGVIATSVEPLQTVAINRPFIFVIREKHTNTILFVGQLTDPGAL